MTKTTAMATGMGTVTTTITKVKQYETPRSWRPGCFRISAVVGI